MGHVEHRRSQANQRPSATPGDSASPYCSGSVPTPRTPHPRAGTQDRQGQQKLMKGKPCVAPTGRRCFSSQRTEAATGGKGKQSEKGILGRSVHGSSETGTGGRTVPRPLEHRLVPRGFMESNFPSDLADLVMAYGCGTAGGSEGEDAVDNSSTADTVSSTSPWASRVGAGGSRRKGTTPSPPCPHLRRAIGIARVGPRWWRQFEGTGVSTTTVIKGDAKASRRCRTVNQVESGFPAHPRIPLHLCVGRHSPVLRRLNFCAASLVNDDLLGKASVALCHRLTEGHRHLLPQASRRYWGEPDTPLGLDTEALEEESEGPLYHPQLSLNRSCSSLHHGVLSFLRLEGCGISDVGLLSFARRVNCAVVELLNCRSVTETGVMVLTQNTTTLRELSCSGVKAEISPMLLQGLAQCSSLRTVRLTGCPSQLSTYCESQDGPVWDEDLLSLCDCSQLEELHLENCSFRALLPWIECCTNLRKLTLSAELMKENVWQVFIMFLRNVHGQMPPKLQHIEVAGRVPPAAFNSQNARELKGLRELVRTGRKNGSGSLSTLLVNQKDIMDSWNYV